MPSPLAGHLPNERLLSPPRPPHTGRSQRVRRRCSSPYFYRTSTLRIANYRLDAYPTSPGASRTADGSPRGPDQTADPTLSGFTHPQRAG